MTCDFIGIYDDAFSKKQCEDYIEFIEELNNTGLMVNSLDDHVSNQKSLNLHYYSYYLTKWSKIGDHFLPSIKDYVLDYIKNYSILKEKNIFFHDCKVKKIPPGGGFHKWHYENSAVEEPHRCLVVQLYLNTIDEGGETEFIYYNKRVNSLQGRLIIFPAYYTHTHRGNAPINQTKYIISSWGKLQ